MDEAMVGVDRGIREIPKNNERLILGGQSLREKGIGDFLIPTLEKSKVLGEMVNEIAEVGQDKERLEFYRLAAEIVNKVLPYADVHDDRGVGSKGRTADMMKNLDNLKHVLDSGFARGAVCRHQAATLLGFLMAMETDERFKKGFGEVKTRGEKSDFVLLGMTREDGFSHLAVYDWKNKIVIDPTYKKVVPLGELGVLYESKLIPNLVKVLQLSDGDTKQVDFKKFFTDPRGYIN